MTNRTPATGESAARIEVRPATLERWDDVVGCIGADGDHGCWCQAWRGPATAYGLPQGAARREMLRTQLAGDVPPGFLAYLDGEVAGWCGLTVRTENPRLTRSRTIPAIDERAVWSIWCFKIRVGYRRKGVASALLAGVVAAAREAGAPGVEAYPVDPAGARIDTGFAFVGLASMFDKAGFRRVLETNAHSAGLPRLLVRLDF